MSAAAGAAIAAAIANAIKASGVVVQQYVDSLVNSRGFGPKGRHGETMEAVTNFRSCRTFGAHRL